MNKFPNEVINQIMLFNSHPVADLLQIAVNTVNYELYEILPGDYEYGGQDDCRADDMSFANYF